MIQTSTIQYQPLSQPSKINSDDERDNSQDPSNDEGEYFSEDDQYDEEDEEDFPIVHYNLPPQKTDDLQKEKLLLQEKLKERNQQILQKKQDLKNQTHPLIFTETDSPISLKRLSRLSRPNSQVKFACYIPERNILIVVLSDHQTINIYSTMNFNLIAVKKSEGAVVSLSYSKHLGMIIVGGAAKLLQLWNPRTFEIEAESLNKRNNWFHSVTYVPKANIIVAKSSYSLDVYNPGLRFLFSVPLPPIYPEAWYSERAQIHVISKNLLLASVSFEKQKGVFLLNLKKKTCKAFSKIFVPAVSCVEHTENNPQHIFSCLAATEENPTKYFPEWHPFNLTQFSVDPKTEELSIVRKTLTTHSFSKLSRLENSKYLMAQKFTLDNSFEMFMLSIKKDKVEVVKVLSRPSSQIILNRIGLYIMTKKGSIVEMDEKAKINVYGYGFVNKNLENKEPIENYEE